jgi:hypothetical protein
MELTSETAGPFLRAVASGLEALAPSDQHVPLAEMLAHLEALDPSRTSSLFAPFELDPASGLPAFAWLDRASSEASALTGASQAGWSDAELSRAQRLEPALADRMRARNWLLNHIQSHSLLPSSRLQIQQRSRGRREGYLLSLDRIMPSLGWMRIRLLAEGPTGWARGLWVRGEDGELIPAEGLRHLLSRHAITPLVVLHRTLEEKLEAWVPQLTRGIVGPFWFPGLAIDALPEPFQGALALHLSSERLGTDVHRSSHRDPWNPPVRGEVVPAGHGLFRERRFAVSRSRVEAVRQWCIERGAAAIVAPIGD